MVMEMATVMDLEVKVMNTSKRYAEHTSIESV